MSDTAPPTPSKPVLGWLLLSVALVLMITMPKRIYIGDPMAMRLATASLLNGHALAVPADVARQFGDRGQYFCEHPTTGKWYSKYGVLSSLFFVPPMAVESAFVGELLPHQSLPPTRKLLRVILLSLYNLVLSLILARYLYRTGLLFAKRPKTVAITVFVVLFGSIVWNYMRAHTVEILHLILFTACFYYTLLARQAMQRNDMKRAWQQGSAAMACGGLLVLGRLVFLPVVGMILVWLAAAMRKQDDTHRQHMERVLRHWSHFTRLGGIAAASVALVLLQNWYCFGSIYSSGYHQWTRFETLFTWEIGDAVYGFLFGPQKSLFLYFPLLLVALPASLYYGRRRPFEYSFAWTALIGFFVVFSAYRDWPGGWCFGPRYLVFLLPVAGLTALDAIERLVAVRWGRWALSVSAIGLLAFSGKAHYPVHNMEFMMVYRIMGVFENAPNHKLVREYFDNRPFWSSLNDYCEFRRGNKPFPPLELIRSQVPATKVARTEVALKRIPTGNMILLPPPVADQPVHTANSR